MILESDPGSAEDFAISIFKFSDPNMTGMLDPRSCRLGGINYYVLYITGYKIKVDQRSMSEKYQSFFIHDAKPLHILFDDVYKSKDVQVMKKVAMDSKR